ncbi:uncharacterized protein LOC135120029 [Zophobas morio]|uniref:uncharacterized protein LOC135120029 n=1 Tax=Zophobas morio TaxID=2755281 RepID=UPI003082CFCF
MTKLILLLLLIFFSGACIGGLETDVFDSSSRKTIANKELNSRISEETPASPAQDPPDKETIEKLKKKVAPPESKENSVNSNTNSQAATSDSSEMANKILEKSNSLDSPANSSELSSNDSVTETFNDPALSPNQPTYSRRPVAIVLLAGVSLFAFGWIFRRNLLKYFYKSRHNRDRVFFRP